MNGKSFFGSTVVALALLGSACVSDVDDSAKSTTTAEQTDSGPTTEAAGGDTTAQAAESTTSTTEEVTTTSTTAAPAGQACAETGGTERGVVTGVEEFVNLRSGPSVNAEILSEIPAGTMLTFYPGTVVSEGERQWVEVMLDSDAGCGSVAAQFIKGPDGKAVGVVSAVSYVERALKGLEPETAHGTFTQINPESPREPFDDAELEPGLEQLRMIGVGSPSAEVKPDETLEVEPEAPDGVGCIFSDGLYCQVQVVVDDIVIATVGVSWYGDGITGLSVDAAS